MRPLDPYQLVRFLLALSIVACLLLYAAYAGLLK